MVSAEASGRALRLGVGGSGQELLPAVLETGRKRLGGGIESEEVGRAERRSRGALVDFGVLLLS